VPAPVSVILPLYNKAAYIRRALDSIASQTYPDFEVLIVNDGSSDGSETIAAGYPDPRFRVIHQANAGPGAARNRGIAEAQGEWVAFLDADDEWKPDFLMRSLEVVEDQGPVAAVTSSYFEYPAVTSTTPMWLQRGIRNGRFRLTPDVPVMQFVHTLAFMCPWSTIVRAGVIRRWGGFYERRCLYAEDAFLWLKILLNETVAFNLEPLVCFHQEASGLSNNRVRDTPIEPFLTDHAEIEAVCPDNLRELLARFLAIRAFKRACVLGYWGKWRQAAQLRGTFSTNGSARLPFYFRSLVASTPAAAVGGRLWRAVRG
jgi:hypothetical protein